MTEIKEWKAELNNLVEATGISLEEVCDYLGVAYRENIGFYFKLPKKRETFIGIGMAFHQDSDKINEWIKRYGKKRKLYAKDLLGDLIWLYLIHAGMKDTLGEINYYKLYDECRDTALEIYRELWDEYQKSAKGTTTMSEELKSVHFDPRFEGLRSFVVENMDSFRTAYSRPRKMLMTYVQAILDTYTRASDGIETPISFLRGFLDDSMINYITGSHETIQVMDMKSRDRSINIKAIPKLKKTHISMCLALGMCADEIDRYLEMMGYFPLDEEDRVEGLLKQHLEKWKAEHPLTGKFKAKYINDEGDQHAQTSLSEKEELQAVSDMLMLRPDLKLEFAKEGKRFPYMKY